MESPTLSIVVPSYRRPEYLSRCLIALQNQKFTDFEVLCVCRETDVATRECISAALSRDGRIKEVIVVLAGVVAAMNAGLGAAKGEIVVFTDDDAQAPSHWLEAIVDHLGNYPNCGAVGGQDRLQIDDARLSDPKPVQHVGRYSLLGRFAATHHCPIEQEHVIADVLKGVNMAFRRDLIKDVIIGDGLRGSYGPQVGHEQGLAAAVTRAGKSLHFVREAWVLHYISPRHENAERLDMATPFALDASFNYSYTLFRYQRLRTAFAALVWQLAVGSWLIPGIPRLVLCPSQWRVTMMHIRPNLQGALEGLRARRRDAKRR